MSAPENIRSETIACVVLNWNGGHDTERCIRSLLDARHVALDILVVDNGSTDGSERVLAALFPHLTILKQQTNLGVAKGFNLGIDWALATGCDFVFFLNNDATVDVDCLSMLRRALESSEHAGIASPRILDGARPGLMWFDGGEKNIWGDPVHRGIGSPSKRNPETHQQHFATGCAMLVRAGVFADVGKFDERFFAYSEDVEFCVRAGRRGWRTIHYSQALATHYPSSATKRNKGKWFRDYYVTRNKLLLLNDELRGMAWVSFVAYFSVKYVLVQCAFFLITGQFRRIAAIFTGVSDYVNGKFGARYS